MKRGIAPGIPRIPKRVKYVYNPRVVVNMFGSIFCVLPAGRPGQTAMQFELLRTCGAKLQPRFSVLLVRDRIYARLRGLKAPVTLDASLGVLACVVSNMFCNFDFSYVRALTKHSVFTWVLESLHCIISTLKKSLIRLIQVWMVIYAMII